MMLDAALRRLEGARCLTFQSRMEQYRSCPDRRVSKESHGEDARVTVV